MGKCVIHPQTHNTPRQKCELPEKKFAFFPQVDRKYGYLKQQAMIPQWVNIGTQIHNWEIELFSSMLKPTFSFFNLLLNPSIFHFLPPTVHKYLLKF